MVAEVGFSTQWFNFHGLLPRRQFHQVVRTRRFSAHHAELYFANQHKYYLLVTIRPMSNKRKYWFSFGATSPIWSSAVRFVLCSATGLVLAAASAGVFAQTGAPGASKNDIDETITHPWVVPSPREADSYFTNLEDGAVVESPFVVRFGLSMCGLVPAGKTVGRAGHHHLLIDRPLPLNFKKPLPFTEQYIHFGKGQMETVLELPPGKYELRLLLADQGHIPYFVYSKPLSVTISKHNAGVKPKDLLGPPHIEIMGLTNGEAVRGPFQVQFHASGYNVSDARAKAPDTGHFRLTLTEVGHKPETLNFIGGQTETWLNPPIGTYSMQLEFVSNAAGNPVLAKTKPLQVPVSDSAPSRFNDL
jgi:hypothetical protein